MADDPPPAPSDPSVAAPPPRPVKLCPACGVPIAAFGRLLPCKHAFCAPCASSMGLCFVCQSTIARVERVDAEPGLFVSPVTLESFHTAAELNAHLAAARSRLGPIRVLPPPPAPGAMPGQQQFHAGGMRPPGMGQPLPPPGMGAVLALPSAPYGGGR